MKKLPSSLSQASLRQREKKRYRKQDIKQKMTEDLLLYKDLPLIG